MHRAVIKCGKAERPTICGHGIIGEVACNDLPQPPLDTRGKSRMLESGPSGCAGGCSAMCIPPAIQDPERTSTLQDRRRGSKASETPFASRVLG